MTANGFPARQRLDATSDRLYLIGREMAAAIAAGHGDHDPASCNFAAALIAWQRLDEYLVEDNATALHRFDALLRRLGVETEYAGDDIRHRSREGVYI